MIEQDDKDKPRDAWSDPRLDTEHPKGCLWIAEENRAYWLANATCDLPHDSGDIPPRFFANLERVPPPYLQR